MPVLKTRLAIHKNVPTGQKDETQTYIPNGVFTLSKFNIQGAYDKDCDVRIEFDGEILFHGKGNEKLEDPITRTGDGIKIAKLILENLSVGNVILGGDAHFTEET